MSPEKQFEPVVLLAEDSEDDAYFFQRAFSKAAVGCSLIRAGNGKLAIEMLEQWDKVPNSLPFIVFLDLKMPVMSGFEVLEWLGSSHLATKLKVIVLSGSNDLADRAKATRLGADEYLVKPISAEVLRTRVLAGLKTADNSPCATGDRA